MNPIPLIIGAMALLLMRSRSDEEGASSEGIDTGDGSMIGSAPSISRTTAPQKTGFQEQGSNSQPQPLPPALPQPQGPASADVPSSSHCADVANWDEDWRAKEQAVLDQLNAIRAAGIQCATGNLQPVPPLTMNPQLRCSARKHSKDMAQNGYFSHVNQQGREHWDRMRDAGYDWHYSSENIAAGRPTAAATMDQWIQSTTGHCEALLDPKYTEIGIGYYAGGPMGHYWTQNFGKEK